MLEAQERLCCFGPCCEDDWCFSSKFVMTHRLSWEQTTKARLLPLWGSYQESQTLSDRHMVFLGPHKPHMLSDRESSPQGVETSFHHLYVQPKNSAQRWTNNVKLSWQGFSTKQLPSISLSATQGIFKVLCCALVQMLLLWRCWSVCQVFGSILGTVTCHLWTTGTLTQKNTTRSFGQRLWLTLQLVNR